MIVVWNCRFLRELWACVAVACAVVLMTGCERSDGGAQTATTRADFEAPLYPDYGDGLVIPCNTAPLNFCLPDSFKRFWVEVSAETSAKRFRTGKRGVRFPMKFWRELLREAYQTGSPIRLDISARTQSGRTYTFPPVHWRVADSIDPYFTYRSVQPISAQSHTILLCERSLESFSEKTLVSNALMENNCFNCHTYHNRNADYMTLHLRNPSEGTLVWQDNLLQKIVPPSKRDLDSILQSLPDSLQMPLSLAYADWHPCGKWIAFSTNMIGIDGIAAHKRFVNILDSASNIVLYEPLSNRIVFDSNLWTQAFEETWPVWSPNGEWLYFCRTAKVSADTVARYPDHSERVHHIFFDLVRIRFLPKEGRFSGPVETVLRGGAGHSYAIPQISPDGKFLLCCSSLFNSVPYQSQGDLVLVDLMKFDSVQSLGQAFCNEDAYARYVEEINSPEDESWHHWSSNGKWVVVSSKRADGFHLNPYFSYFDGRQFSRPFLLPQKNPNFYKTALRAFNLPMFVKNASGLTPEKVSQAKRNQAVICDVQTN